MKNEVILGEYHESLKDSCLELLRKTFPASRVDDILSWKSRGYNSRESFLALARLDNRVVSFNSWFPWEYSHEGRIHAGYQSGDSATHHSFREMGLWSKVLEFSIGRLEELRGADFLFGFPNRQSSRGISKAGFVPVCDVPYRIRPMLPFIGGMSSPIHDAVCDLCSLLSGQERMITPNLSNDYLTWRYAGSYERIEYIQGGCRACFFILRKTWKGLNEVLLLDCRLGSFERQFLKNAFRHLDAACAKNTLFIRTFFNESSKRGKAMKPFFPFTVSSKHRSFFVKPISGSIPTEILFDWNSWDIMPHCIDDL